MSLAHVAHHSYLALVHHPVYDRHRKVVATSITNLDIHDIARSSRTYELAGYFLVHPVTAQRRRGLRQAGHAHVRDRDVLADAGRRHLLALDQRHGGDVVTMEWTDRSGTPQSAAVTLVPGPVS